MLKKSLLIWITLILAACTSQPTSSPEREDAAIYLAALKYEFKIQTVVGLVVTGSSPVSIPESFSAYIRTNFKDLADTEALDNFIAANQNPIALDEIISELPGVILLSKDEVSQIFRSNSLESGWKAFYNKYPLAVGLIYVSNIGYNRAYTQAFVSIGRQSGPLNGYGEYLYLEKINGAWLVKKSLMAWIS